MPDADLFSLPDLSSLPELSRIVRGTDFWSLRIVDEQSDTYCVRKNVALPPFACRDRGAMATVYADGGFGYAATDDTSPAGLAAALARAAAGCGHRRARASR